MTRFKHTARMAYAAARRARLNSVSNAMALEALRNRAAIAPVPPGLQRTIDDYAIAVFGSRVFAPWLYLYTSVAGTFREGWLPDNYYGTVVVPRINAGDPNLSMAKSLSRRVLDTQWLPDLAYVLHGRAYGRDMRPIANLTGILPERFVFKRDGIIQGLGVQVFSHGQAFDPAGLPNGVIQPFIRQHQDLETLSPDAVATLRLTTTIEPDGTVALRAAYLRLGRRGDGIVTSARHVRVPIDVRTGRLGETGYLPSWLPTDRHPDTGTSFSGRLLPSFVQCVQASREMHGGFPTCQCIGWDWAVDADGRPILMEWNGGHNGHKFPEATTGPCFQGLGWEHLWKRE
ncbi:MAG: sugar-transfer associated ATP-grasp domain-containing protein [Devosia sp.]